MHMDESGAHTGLILRVADLELKHGGDDVGGPAPSQQRGPDPHLAAKDEARLPRARVFVAVGSQREKLSRNLMATRPATRLLLKDHVGGGSHWLVILLDTLEKSNPTIVFTQIGR